MVVCGPALFPNAKNIHLGGGHEADVVFDSSNVTKKVEVKATGSKEFQEFGPRDVKADFLVWIAFGSAFENESEDTIRIYVLDEPRRVFPNGTKITLTKFKEQAAGKLTSWSFTASDGRVDRAGDVIAIAGIDLDAYLQNPIWHHSHNYDWPIGRSASIEKVGGKLKSVLELGIGVFPMAATVQKMLVSKMLSACSIGFDPITWSYNKARDGIDFSEISLREISTCGVPVLCGGHSRWPGEEPEAEGCGISCTSQG